jgi:hypothetical protein
LPFVFASNDRRLADGRVLINLELHGFMNVDNSTRSQLFNYFKCLQVSNVSNSSVLYRYDDGMAEVIIPELDGYRGNITSKALLCGRIFARSVSLLLGQEHSDTDSSRLVATQDSILSGTVNDKLDNFRTISNAKSGVFLSLINT